MLRSSKGTSEDVLEEIHYPDSVVYRTKAQGNGPGACHQYEMCQLLSASSPAERVLQHPADGR